MELITEPGEIAANVDQLWSYIAESGLERDFALDLIRNGSSFVVTERNGQPFFAPSRFVGYRSNSRDQHMHNPDKDGRETNRALSRILGKRPVKSASLEQEYDQFCQSLGVDVRTAPFGNPRKFWDLR